LSDETTFKNKKIKDFVHLIKEEMTCMEKTTVSCQKKILKIRDQISRQRDLLDKNKEEVENTFDKFEEGYGTHTNLHLELLTYLRKSQREINIQK